MKKWIAFILCAMIAVSSQASQLPDFPFVFVEGEAKTDLPPNMAQVSLELNVFDVSSSNALAMVDKESKSLLSFLAASKIKQEDIRADDIEKETVWKKVEDGQSEKHEIDGYKVRRRFSARIRNLDIYENLIQSLLSTQHVADVNTLFDRSDRKKIEGDLLSQACQDAKERADNLAKGFGSELGPVFAITQSGFYGMGGLFGVAGDESGRGIGGSDSGLEGGGSPETKLLFIPATIRFNNGVLAIFKLKNDKK